MSYYLGIDSQHVPLASVGGLGDLRHWTETLDPSVYPEAVHFLEHGWSQETTTLTSQLQAALKTEPPDDPSVVSTVETLIDNLKSHYGAPVATVTDGLGAKV